MSFDAIGHRQARGRGAGGGANGDGGGGDSGERGQAEAEARKKRYVSFFARRANKFWGDFSSPIGILLSGMTTTAALLLSWGFLRGFV